MTDHIEREFRPEACSFKPFGQLIDGYTINGPAVQAEGGTNPGLSLLARGSFAAQGSIMLVAEIGIL